MCGICGIIHNKNKHKLDITATVLKMNNAIIHRGPDEDGTYQDDHCSLAMRRLSIIDLGSGKQPLYNEDKSILAFLNGEIYNYKELKKDLQSLGHVFYTNSDTEVLPHLYEEHGINFTRLLKGMFSLCIYDLKKETWFFARDRFGEKPFFYYKNDTSFSFSSEIYSLLENPEIPRTLNLDALPIYLSNALVPEPFTLFKDILTLPPGHYLEYCNQKVNVKSFFPHQYKVDQSLKTERDCIDFLEPVLNTAVQRQMISDVPIGAFLSGGIDSSTVVAKMQEYSNTPIKTFNVKFQDAKYDESPIAREVAVKLGTDHHELVVENQTFSREIFWKIIKHIGVPFHDTSAIPTFFITQEIKKHVTVALSGDGGDELFAGYPFYQWWAKVHKLRTLPKILRSLGTLTTSPTSLQKIPKVRQLSRALEATEGSIDEIGPRMTILFSPREIKKLSPRLNPSFKLLSQFPEQSTSWTSLKKALYYKLKHELPLDMLIKVDRMSMANSLEVRAPFLDPDLFEASTKIPDKFLINGTNGKHIIRKVMEKKLPDSVFNHPKSGFSIPLHKYMNDDFYELCDELILHNTKMLQLFDKEQLEQYVTRGLTQKKDGHITVYRATHQLWSLMQLGGWIKYFEVNVN